MSLIKGKQIQSLPAAKIVESAEKKLVSQAQIDSFAGKAETSDVEAAKTAASEALAAARVEITSEIGTAKTQAVASAAEHTDAEVAKVTAKVSVVEGSVATGLQDRYTKSEIDTKLAQLGAGIKYKGTVASFEEIATKFPNPEEGWLVAVEGTKKFYVYDADTSTWDNFPIDMGVCTTYANTIRISVTNDQTAINTGIKTDGTGSLQTSTQLADKVTLAVNGQDQTKTTDYTVATVENQVVITWKSTDFALEETDVVTVTYNQTV